jgi:ABC-type antimicrobial peptide transport system permease subunit
VIVIGEGTRERILGVACSTILGLVIGVIPAARAARIEPIAALRAE